MLMIPLLLVFVGPLVVFWVATRVFPAGTARNFPRLLFAALWCTPVPAGAPGSGGQFWPSSIFLWNLALGNFVSSASVDYLPVAVAVSIAAVLGSVLLVANSLRRLYRESDDRG